MEIGVKRPRVRHDTRPSRTGVTFTVTSWRSRVTKFNFDRAMLFILLSIRLSAPFGIFQHMELHPTANSITLEVLLDPYIGWRLD